MISTSIPVRSRTASTNASLFCAMRNPAVPTATVATTSTRAASSAISAIASTVRPIGSSFSSLVRSSPSPSLVTSARSTIARHSLSSRFSPITNLTELVPTSTTAKRPSANELLEAPRDTDVPLQVEPELAHRRGHECRIFRLDGDRPQDAPVSAQLGELGHCTADGHVPAPLVHLDREQVGARVDDVAEQLIERVLGSRERHVDAEHLEDRLDLSCVQREPGLQHRLPLLQPVLVDTLKLLHVHPTAAHLDRRVARDREQVEIVALLLDVRGQLTEKGLGVTEALAERPPLPPGCYPRARLFSSRS